MGFWVNIDWNMLGWFYFVLFAQRLREIEKKERVEDCDNRDANQGFRNATAELTKFTHNQNKLHVGSYCARSASPSRFTKGR